MPDVGSLKQHNRREDNPLRERRYLVLDKWPPKQLNILKSFLEIIATLPDEAAANSFYNGVRMTYTVHGTRLRQRSKFPIRTA